MVFAVRATDFYIIGTARTMEYYSKYYSSRKENKEQRTMKYWLVIIGIGLLCWFGRGTALAAESSVPVGITLSPTIEELTLNQNQTSVNYPLQITNNTNSPVAIHISAQDFTEYNDNGAIDFLNNTVDDTNDPHGLLSALSIGLPELALGPKQTETVPINIINTDLLAPGGHYAALLVSSGNISGLKGNQVGINQSVSSLIFLSTAGEGTQSTELHTPLIGGLFGTFPQTINAVFGNTGNTQTTLRGYVQIFRGKTLISQNQINTTSGLILPESTRLFQLQVNPPKHYLWPGVYTLVVTYGHDGDATFTVYKQNFLYISSTLVISVIFEITVIVGIIVRYRRRPIAKRELRK
jgi:hypothetical protein